MTNPQSGDTVPELATGFDNPEPITLTPAEMAVMFRRLLGETAAVDAALRADLDLGPEEIAQARKRLIERGLLIARPGFKGDALVAPPLFLQFNTVTRPAVLGTLEVARPGQAARMVNYSWRGGWFVRNHVDENGNHVLRPLASAEALADDALRETGIEPAGPAATSEPAPAQPTADREAVARAATLRAVLMVVANASTPRQEAQALSWLVSGGQLWLVARSQQPDQAGMRVVSPAELRAAVLGHFNAAIARSGNQ